VQCALGVCRHCAHFDTRMQVWTCNKCSNYRCKTQRKGGWISGHRRRANWTYKVRDTPPAVRQHTEYLLEDLLGGPIHIVNRSAGPLPHLNSLTFSSPTYLQLYEKHHPVLAQKLTELTNALTVCFENGDTLSHGPANVHMGVSRIVKQIRNDVKTITSSSSKLFNHSYDDVEESMKYGGESYEDTLATTVINKVVMMDQADSGRYSSVEHEGGDERATDGRNDRNVSDNRCVTESPMIKMIDFVTINNYPAGGFEDASSVSSSSRPSSAAFSNSSSDRSMRSATVSPIISEFSKSGAASNIVIREDIEEVLTTYSDDDDKLAPSGYNSSYPNMPGFCLDEMDLTSSAKVSFPELGLDLVSGEASDCDDCPCIVTVSDMSWQHNWLFKKQSESARNTMRQTPPQPVSMLVPNPVEAAKAQIGNKDFDLVSELSERQSVASFELSASDSDEEMLNDDCTGQRKVSDECEKDQEYTIYDLLPVRRSTISSPGSAVKPSITTTSLQKMDSFVTIVNPGQTKGDLELTSCPENLTTHEGKIVTLMCTVRGSKPLDVGWFHGSEAIHNNSKYWTYRKKDSHFLTIFNATKTDCGKFNLVAFNKTGEIWHSFNMLVRGTRRAENPPEIIKHPISMENLSGENVEMLCQVQGYPEPRVEFYKEGRLISCNENNNIEYRNHGEWALTIARLGARTEGLYSVTAENDLGSSTRDWQLKVVNKDTEEDIYEDMTVQSADDRDIFSAKPAIIDSKRSSLESVDGFNLSFENEHHDNRDKTDKTTACSKNIKELKNIAENNITIVETRNKSVKASSQDKRRVILLDNEVGETNTDDPIRCSNSPEEVDPAPAPGSLADREHRKWVEKAVTLDNNPYTTENIVKRRLSRSNSFNAPNHLSSTESNTTTRGSGYSDHARKIDCGLRSVNAARYNRDYFINKNGSEDRSVDVSFSPEEMVEYMNSSSPTGQSNEVTEESLGEHSEENNNDSLGDSKQWDSGVGSSSERTSTSTISVSEGIKKFEEEIHRSEQNLNSHIKWLTHKSSNIGSVDSLLGWTTDEPPALPARNKFLSEDHLLPPPLPARRTMVNQKKVTYAENEVTVHGVSSDQESVSIIRCNNEVYEETVNDSEDEEYINIIPTLPSVKDLATKFQPKKSPEPKPRKSLIKKKSFENRISRGNKSMAGSFQVSQHRSLFLFFLLTFSLKPITCFPILLDSL